MAGNTITVTDQSFSQDVLQSELPVLVDFWATWCPPCRVIGPILEELAGTFAGNVIIAKLDSDENPRTTVEYGVQGLPTIVVFHNGEVVDELVGARPKAFYTTYIQNLIERTATVRS